MLPFYSYTHMSFPISHHCPLTITDLFFISIILPFQECHINRTKVCDLLGLAFLVSIIPGKFLSCGILVHVFLLLSSVSIIWDVIICLTIHSFKDI